MQQERTAARQRAVLAGVDTGEYDAEISMQELCELAETAGAQVVGTVLQRRPSLDGATCLGSGRLEELKGFCQEQGVELAIFDHELTAAQIRNIERILEIPAIDRTALILDIFAQRARTSEGRLQVELAQLEYRLPRLAGLGTSLSRLGGGIGTRGPGETKLESDRRHIRGRIQALKRQLEEVDRRRQLIRSRRRKDGIPTVAIVGYTNVGKSTLLGTLTEAGVLAEDQLFATLDPTARALSLPDGRTVMLIDTVGLVRRLPHQLVSAFRSTLEEAVQADLILMVCDASSDEMEEQADVTRQLLGELGAGGIPVVMALNKCDRLPRFPARAGERVPISAKTGQGLPELLDTLARALGPTQVRMQLLLPYTAGGLLEEIRREGKILSEEYLPEGIRAVALVDQKIAYKAEPYARPHTENAGE